MNLEKWKQCDVYVQGSSHKATGDPCQDRTYSLTKNGVIAIALADGAGSKTMSHIGAEIVTHAVCELLCEKFDELIVECEVPNGANKETYQNSRLVKTVLTYLLKQLDTAAVKENVAISELSSTLLFFAMKEDFYIYGHIGDGTIGILDSSKHGYVEVVSQPENGDQPNITFFIPDSNAANHLRIYGKRKSNIYGVILMSDGTADLLYQKNIGQFNENTINLFKNYKLVTRERYKSALAEFLTKTVAEFSDDDLSVNLLFRESISTNEEISEQYKDLFVSDIKSKEQIVELSADGRMLKDYAPYKKQDFSSIKQVREYLEW